LDRYEANARTTVEARPTTMTITPFSILRVFELARVLVRFDHVASFIVNAPVFLS